MKEKPNLIIDFNNSEKKRIIIFEEVEEIEIFQYRYGWEILELERFEIQSERIDSTIFRTITTLSSEANEKKTDNLNSNDCLNEFLN